MKKALGLSTAALGLSALMLAAPAMAATISTQMDIGATGSDVTTLQQTLATDTSIYPQGLVTGYFGSLSAAAVSRFQAKYGLPQVGRVGPQTIAKFNEVYGAGVSTNSAPLFSSVSTSANNSGMTVMWSTSQPSTGTIFYSTSPLVVSEPSAPGQTLTVSGTNVLTSTAASNTSNSVTLTNVTPNTTYYYMIQAVNASGQVSVTWPATFTTN